METLIEKHPFEPFFPEGARILMCGTFPARPERWCMNFYYPNFQNDMWRIFGLIYFGDKEYFVDREHKTYKVDLLKSFLAKEGIALSDTGREIIRTKGNAADKDLKIEKPIDLAAVLAQLPEVTDIAITGKLAADVMSELTHSVPPKMGEYRECSITDANGKMRHLRHWRMPSTSRAYPAPLAGKAEAYARLFKPDTVGQDAK